MPAQKAPLGAGDTKDANRQLEEVVQVMLNGDEQLKAAQLTVSADVTGNQVTLTGTVTSEESRRRAVDLAKSAQAGVVVSDKLSVKRNAPKTEAPW